ncbi:hypothetical protein BJF95_13340 [Rhizobium oryziradicis]|uniref:Transposase n=1 Tax=Rhizobium oryziradicis TaxID=1867956 RepID=A0A1Q8ZKK2_9HYPH|nr:hypothetical protein BJF95_13340 [Rhizobium oryziradicis]
MEFAASKIAERAHDFECHCRKVEAPIKGLFRYAVLRFKGRHFEAWLIVLAVSWYLRYPLNYRDLEEMFAKRGFQSFNTARRTIASFEAMLWLENGFGFSGGWTVNDQNNLPACLFGLRNTTGITVRYPNKILLYYLKSNRV